MAKRRAKKESKGRGTGKKPIESYDHQDKKRANNPPVGLVTPETDPERGAKKTYQYDLHLDPQLVWAGKAEHTSFEVPTVSLHVHERIDPKTIIEAVRKRNRHPAMQQLSLFETPAENPPLREAIEFYKHAHNWTNRLIAGDSLLVMNSLLEKEGMAGKVQMVYIDPPYGIRYGSNFQPFVNKRDVSDGKDDDLTQEPEMIRAFRDTWELGIHSYLTYLRDRLLLARELLHESGSCFVQINDRNLALVRQIADEVFGTEGLVAIVTFRTTANLAGSHLGSNSDYLVWYARSIGHLKYHQLYKPKTYADDIGGRFTRVELGDGTRRVMTSAERGDPSGLPAGSLIYRHDNLVSQGATSTSTVPFDFEGTTFHPGANSHWKTTLEGLSRLQVARRLAAPTSNSLTYVRYLVDFPVAELTNVWGDTQTGAFTDPKVYAVQTNTKVIGRCILMTTDPGDLVLDPTCGSGTTAYVAEQWGRRWITCDTSRVSIALAKQRLMTALYDYYEIAHPDEGVGSGFKYKTVPHVMLKSIANNPEIKEGMSRKQIDAAIAKYADQETLYDQPFIDKSRARVSGPFTVEAVPAPAVRSIAEVAAEPQSNAATEAAAEADLSVGRSGETLRQDEWRDELLKCGIRGKSGQRVEFSRVEALAGTRWLHADAETRPLPSPPPEGEGANVPERVVVSFGPEHAPLEQRQVEQALEEAQLLKPKPKMVVFASFQFDPEAAKDIDETNWPSVTLLKVQMNTDLLTDDLKKKRASNDSFWMIGQPDVVVDSEQWLVNSRREALAPYAIIAELSGTHRVAEINGLGRDDLSLLVAIAQRRDLWAAVATDAGGGVDSGEHRRGAGEARDGGVTALSGHRARLPGRIGDAGHFVRELTAISARDRSQRIERLRGSREIADRAREIAAKVVVDSGQGIVDSKKKTPGTDHAPLSTIHYPLSTIHYPLSTIHYPLSTIHYSQVTIQGFDYYNPREGKIESGDTSKIAMWMLDTDYDGRSLYPRQVFFPMAGPKDGWARLAKNLKAEIDEELIEAYRGTVSLPFEPGDHKRVAVKIIDDRGIESLKIVRVG